MSNWLNNHWVFWRQFREQFHTTGAIAPSGRFLGRALARYVGGQPEHPQRLLEVGPGTGAVTSHIVKRMAPGDSLDLVELNTEFVRRLNERFAAEPAFQRVADRAQVFHCRLEELTPTEGYDLIISGLPLNNFSVADVQCILAAYAQLLRPGGVLSFFEYVAIRKARAIVSSAPERERLRGIGRAMDGLLGPYEIKRDCIWPNLPPAWVHHCRLPGVSAGTK